MEKLEFVNKMKKRQYSFEFMMIFGFVLVILAGLGYYFTGYSESIENDLDATRSGELGEQLLKKAKDAYHKSGYYKETIYTRPPESLIGISVENTDLIMTLSNENGGEHLFLKNEFPLSNMIIPEEIAGGVFTIEKKRDIVILCTGTLCSCTEAEDTIEICSDGLDNDCDGKADQFDDECP